MVGFAASSEGQVVKIDAIVNADAPGVLVLDRCGIRG
jgi:hypothetical protein